MIKPVPLGEAAEVHEGLPRELGPAEELDFVREALRQRKLDGQPHEDLNALGLVISGV